jgi:hypothetical protein
VVRSAAPKIWRVSRRAERDIEKFGRSGVRESGSSLGGSGSGIVQLKVVKRALSRKTIPGSLLHLLVQWSKSTYLASLLTLLLQTEGLHC